MHRLQTLAPSLCRAVASSSLASARAAPLSTSSVAAFRRTSPLLSSPGKPPSCPSPQISSTTTVVTSLLLRANGLL
jgi:hypothetical protein